MDRRSTGLPPPGLTNTRIVRRRDENVVSGDIDRKTGSSLYSRDTMIHMSMPVRVISCGSTVSNRF